MKHISLVTYGILLLSILFVPHIHNKIENRIPTPQPPAPDIHRIIPLSLGEVFTSNGLTIQRVNNSPYGIILKTNMIDACKANDMRAIVTAYHTLPDSLNIKTGDLQIDPNMRPIIQIERLIEQMGREILGKNHGVSPLSVAKSNKNQEMFFFLKRLGAFNE